MTIWSRRHKFAAEVDRLRVRLVDEMLAHEATTKEMADLRAQLADANAERDLAVTARDNWRAEADHLTERLTDEIAYGRKARGGAVGGAA